MKISNIELTLIPPEDETEDPDINRYYISAYFL
jgi:hypothetical protein